MKDIELSCSCGKDAVVHVPGNEYFEYVRLDQKGRPQCRKCEERHETFEGEVMILRR